MLGLKLSSDQNFANGGTLIRELTTLDRDHLVAEFDFGRDAYTSRANSGDPTKPAGIYGAPTYADYSVQLVAPKVGDPSGAKWIDSGVADLGNNFTIAFIVNPRSAADYFINASDANDPNSIDGIMLATNGASGMLLQLNCKDTATNAASPRQVGYLTPDVVNAPRMVVVRVGGMVDPTMKFSHYRAGGLLGAVLTQANPGYTRRPSGLPFAFGSYRGAAPVYNNTGDRPQDFYGAWIWAGQTVMPSDAAILAFYNEQRERYAALGVTI